MPEDLRADILEQFNERQLSELTLAVVVIRGWNMLNVGLGKALPAN